MGRFFNIAGPCNPARHYMLPAVARLPDVLRLIEDEAYPHIVLQAFLQRVINGGGEIIREMALGKGALDLGVLFRGAPKNGGYYVK